MATLPWVTVALVAVPLLVLAVLLAGSGATTWPRRRHDDSPRHLWVGARASSADGALVHLQAEVTYRLTAATANDDGAAAAATAVAEHSLRQAIVSRRLLALPGSGDEVPVRGAPPLEGLVVDRVVVAAADAEITRELRRLVGGP
ncbi:MAG TPA: hypothetical protein VF728_04080 [Nocardioides sp.]